MKTEIEDTGAKNIEAKNLRNKTHMLTLCGLFTAMIAIGAFIQIPVPHMDYFTLQFFFVLLAGMLLGSKRGALSVVVYVAVGLIGVPIFAAGGGIGYIVRPSFGYLLGFIAAAFVAGWVCEKIQNKRYSHYVTAALCGFFVTYAIGLTYKYFILNLYLGQATPWSIVILSCFPLDIPGDLILCVVAALVGKRLERVTLQYKEI